jgi:hypothetical protein
LPKTEQKKKKSNGTVFSFPPFAQHREFESYVLMLSPAALGITPAQLYVRSRSPVEAFKAFDPDGVGFVTLDDARKALKSVGVKVNLSEAKALALAQVDGDRGVPHANITFNYNQFLQAAGATSSRAKDADAPMLGVTVPSSSKEVSTGMVSRILKERGSAAEGYKSGLVELEVPKVKEYIGRHASHLDTVGGLKTFLSEDESPPPPRAIKNIHQSGEFTTAGIGSFNMDPSGTAITRKSDALQVGVLDKVRTWFLSLYFCCRASTTLYFAPSHLKSFPLCFIQYNTFTRPTKHANTHTTNIRVGSDLL